MGLKENLELNKTYLGEGITSSKKLSDNSIDLVVTSPQYANTVSYGRKVKKMAFISKRYKKMRTKQIFSLLNNYDINEIENSLIYLFIEKIKTNEIKNKLIKDRLKKINLKTTEFLSHFLKESNIDLTLKNMEKIFELLIKPEDRKLNGAFYTPDFIVEYINDYVIKKSSDFKVCDCSCGSGAFLIKATEKISKKSGKGIIETIEKNIYGVDIMERSIERTKLLLSLLALQNGEDKEDIKFNVKIGDSLNNIKFDWKKEFPEVFEGGGFDGVVGNPPYVRIQDFNKNIKNLLINQYKTSGRGNFNLYFAFFEMGLKLLKKDGKLGYITPNNYFTSLAGRTLREFLQINKLVDRIIDFNHLRIFEDATTYTCITFLNKKNKELFEFSKVEDKKLFSKLKNIKYSNIKFSELGPKKWRLIGGVDFYNIKQIENIGIRLGKFADIKVGIATLKDNLYLLDGNRKKGDFYIKEHNGQEYLIEMGLTRKIVKIASVNSDESIKRDKRRIIFPYVKKGKRHYLIDEEILKRKYPKTYSYLLEIKKELSTRDKGKTRIPKWYAYGRGQGLNLYGKKLLTKTFNNKPNFMVDEGEYSLFCNGYAVFPKNEEDLNILKKILNSDIMNYYTRKTSVEIGGDYQCYQKNFIESFSIPKLSEEQKAFLLNEKDKVKIRDFLIKIYKLKEKVY